MKRRSLSEIWKARQGEGKRSKNMTNIQTLHHYIYIVSLAGGRQNKQKRDKHTHAPPLHIYHYHHHHHHDNCNALFYQLAEKEFPILKNSFWKRQSGLANIDVGNCPLICPAGTIARAGGKLGQIYSRSKPKEVRRCEVLCNTAK